MGNTCGLCLAVCLVVLASCAADTTPSTTSQPSVIASTSSTTTTTHVTTTTPATTTTTQGPGIGELFTDPEGSYQIRVGDDWIPNHGVLAAGVEVWYVEPIGEFTANLNILNQVAPPGMSMSDYLDFSAETAVTFVPDFVLLDHAVITSPSGQELGIFEYQGSPSGFDLHFLAAVAFNNGEVITATFTSPPKRFNRLRRLVEPYLLTLTAAP